MTRSDKWKKRPCVMKYRKFSDELRSYIPSEYELPQPCRIVFYLPFPKSYSKKKKESLLGKPHKLKPDIDNLVKSILDAMYENDQHIWSIWATKYWATNDYYKGGIIIGHI